MLNPYRTTITFTNAIKSDSHPNAVRVQPGAALGDLVWLGVSKVACRPGWVILLEPCAGGGQDWTFKPLTPNDLWDAILHRLFREPSCPEEMFMPILEAKSHEHTES